MNDECEVEIARFGRPQVRIGLDQMPACRAVEPWVTTFRGLATYTIPKVAVQVSAIMRSQIQAASGAVALSGGWLSANYQMNRSQFLAATGRPLRSGLSSQTVNLLLPGQLYGDRVNVVDVRVAKILRLGRTRTNIGVDLYNMFNRNTPTAYHSTFDPTTIGVAWGRPTSILLPRFVRINAQLDF